jgi:hypothetical protein
MTEIATVGDYDGDDSDEHDADDGDNAGYCFVVVVIEIMVVC